MMLSQRLIPLNSACVKAAAWLNGRIAIKFPNGTIRFYPATVQRFQELMKAAEQGKAGEFYNKHIKFKKGSGPQGGNCSPAGYFNRGDKWSLTHRKN